MNNWAGLFAVLPALIFAGGCAQQLPARSVDPGAAAETQTPALSAPEVTCEKEAERLIEPVRVFAAPAENAAELASLRAGRMIYRCDRWKDWTSISYPAEGESVDCASRTEQRRCAVGWVYGSLQTAIFG